MIDTLKFVTVYLQVIYKNWLMHAVSLNPIKDPIVDDELMTQKVITEPQQKKFLIKCV